MTVKIWRLFSGDEIIGTDVSCELGFVQIKKPAVLQLMPGPGGQSQMGMGPLMPMAKKGDEVTIASDKILYSYEPLESLSNEYNKNFGGGIVTNSSQLII